MATPVGTAATVQEGYYSTVSWGAVIAGGIASAAVSLLLIAFGVGLGFAVVSPWSDQGVSASTFHIGAGLYLIVVAMLSSTVGGYLAGRLRARWAEVHGDEVFFRDTAHGFLAWAVALVLGATALGSATTHLLAGASAGLIPAAGASATMAASSTDGYVDALLRADPAPANPANPTASPTPVAGDLSTTRAEVGRVLLGGLRKGADVSPADRAYLTKVVSARTGLLQAEADRRVAEVITQAKTAADESRKAAAKLSLWLAAAMLAGAFAASLAATEGGVLRDSRWYEPGWRKAQARSYPAA